MPKFLTFFVTNQCNAKCGHCFNWKNQSIDELSLEEIKKIDFSIFTSVSLTGGEPTLRVDLAEICNHVAKNKIYLNTNGLMPQRIKEVIEKVGSDLVSVTVSLDGIKDLHDQIRGVNCFDAAVKTINLCQDASVDVTVLTTISRFNTTNISSFMNYLKTEGLFTQRGDVVFNIARGVKHVFNFDTSIGFYHNPRDDTAVLTLSELQIVYSQIKPYMTNQNRVVWEYSIKMLSEHKKLVTCYAGNMDIVLHANGDVTACEYSKPFANIKDYNFNILTLWNSKNADTTRNKLSSCYCIHPCNLNTAIPRTLTGLLKLAPDIARNKINQFKNKL
ncbi:MAG: radical SAM protein [Nitrososphaerota archaeon]|jgi:MoaA/NifB/PqqE/SkfB family radical SAM enzyme|nr:radical SAM protein [Nitrososphaerota archaeon]